MDIGSRIRERIKKANSLVCIGLDSEYAKLPKHLAGKPHAQSDFNAAIVDATQSVAAAFKPNTAFYEARGAEGIHELKLTCDYIRGRYPDIPIILDAKRGDIGNTNEGYATFAFDYLGADAITLQPYLGREALAPFLNRPDRGCIILCRTSNPGAGEYQDLTVSGEPLYLTVAHRVSSEWNENGNCMLVVGATYPEELKNVRTIAGDMPFLVPGIGAQGGNVQETIMAGQDSMGGGMLINSSRGIIFVSGGTDFAECAAEEATKLKDEINRYRKTVI